MPDLHPSAWIAPSAQIFGAVAVGERASVWHNAVLRAECQEIRIGRLTNVQDFVLIHVPYDGRRSSVHSARSRIT
jgi:carbonic anhydrase/acetyltransferase-like protein (isoleucine patch superfamily)